MNLKNTLIDSGRKYRINLKIYGFILNGQRVSTAGEIDFFNGIKDEDPFFEDNAEELGKS